MSRVSRRGQSIGEYAILFAIVLGAIVAMQGYIRNRIAGGLQSRADNYMTTLGATTATQLTSTSNSTSRSRMNMQSVNQGTVGSGSEGTSGMVNIPQ